MMTLHAHTLIQIGLAAGGVTAAYWLGDTPKQALATALLVACGIPIGFAWAALIDHSRQRETSR